ncbi:MAG: orotate phosphoribosyltransferase, partial [Planctomycetaceae bacterium]
MPSDATTDLLALMSPRKGHFRFESGHHGETWLEIPRLFLRPASLRPFVKQLARRLSPHRVEAVCGPAVEGALLAQMVAEELELAFFFAEKVTNPHGRATGPAACQIPESLRDAARGKNFAVVDDVINAGSAVQAVLDDFSACGARPVAIGALMVLGQSA